MTNEELNEAINNLLIENPYTKEEFKINRYKKKIKTKKKLLTRYKQKYTSFYYDDSKKRIKRIYYNSAYFKNQSNRKVRRIPLPFYSNLNINDEESIDNKSNFIYSKNELFGKGNSYKKLYEYLWTIF